MKAEHQDLNGRLLRVNLSDGTIRVEDLKPEWVEDFVGGVGYAARLLYEELPPGADPLGPENKLVLATGPLTLNRFPGGGSLAVCFKAPLTGAWGESRTGGDIGPQIRRAGFDHVVIEGRSGEPVCLVIENGAATLKPAHALAGLLVSEKLRQLRETFGLDGYEFLTIGPGGENLVRYAGVMSGDRAAGRCGGGAVMGAKNLLAVAVKGTLGIPEADPERLKQATRQALEVVRENPNSAAFRAAGTIGDLPGNDESGDWPTKNWQSNSWGKGAELFDSYEKRNFLRDYGCYKGCSIRCGRKVHVPDGPYQTPEHGGAEYESVTCFTAFVLNEDMDAAIHTSWLCNEYGIDTISTGGAIAFAMDCFERGLITRQDVDGLDLSWGNGAVLPVLVKMIAGRRGIGDLLAEGVKRAAERLGGTAREYAIHVKGLEGPAHDPRSGKSLALTYGTGNRGMCHIHPVEAMAWDKGKLDFGLRKHGLADPEAVDRWDEDGKGAAVRLLQDALILPDVMGVCKFFMYAGLTVEHMAAMYSALSGRDVDAARLLTVGERVSNIQRLFNLREGLSRADDDLPRRVLSVPTMGFYKDQPQCVIGDYDRMIRDYYQARGWDPDTGRPSAEKLAALRLS